MPDPIDKRALMAALRAHLAAEISSAAATLEGRDGARERIHWSDCTDNLRALMRVEDPERAILVFELEENEFDADRLASTARHLALAVDAPCPLSGVMTVQGRDYRLSNRTGWHESASPGMAFSGASRRDERWWSQLVVIAKA